MKWVASGIGYYNGEPTEKSAIANIFVSSASVPSTVTVTIELFLGEHGHYRSKNARMLTDALLDNKLGMQLRTSFELIALRGDSRFIEFLKIVNQHESLTCDVYCDLLRKVGCIEQAAIQKMTQLVEDGQFDEAITFSEEQQREKKYEVIWSLATLLAKKLEEDCQDTVLEQLKTVYSFVSENSPHFQEANEELYNLSLNKTFESEDARARYLFEVAMKSGNQTLIRYSCGDLLGVGMALPPELTDIQLNVETLVQVAGLHKRQVEKIKDLEEMNQQLQQNVLARKDGLTTQSLFKVNFGPVSASKSIWPGYK